MMTFADLVRFYFPFWTERLDVLNARLKRGNARRKRLLSQLRELEARQCGIKAEIAYLRGDD